MDRHGLFVCLVGSLIMVVAAIGRADAQNICATGTTCVLTWQYDNHRSGQNLTEGSLLYNNLTSSHFGQLCSLQVDGQVYAQPLVVTNVTINGTFYPYAT